MSISTPIRVVVSGAAGRMGQALSRLTLASDRLELSGATEAPSFQGVGDDVGQYIGAPDTGVTLTGDVAQAASQAQAFVDFTRPQATLAALAALEPTSVNTVVVGTTGFSDDELLAFQEWSKRYTLIYSGNYSLGVNMLAELVRRAAKSLDEDWDIEVFEAHHRHKVDAPSGTALLLGEAAADGRGSELSELRIPPYDGVTGERPTGKIGFSVVRSGGIIGDHEVSFGSEQEVLTLSHRALDRQVFARGALKAVEWGVDKPNGLYSMKDVLGL